MITSTKSGGKYTLFRNGPCDFPHYWEIRSDFIAFSHPIEQFNVWGGLCDQNLNFVLRANRIFWDWNSSRFTLHNPNFGLWQHNPHTIDGEGENHHIQHCNHYYCRRRHGLPVGTKIWCSLFRKITISVGLWNKTKLSKNNKMTYHKSHQLGETFWWINAVNTYPLLTAFFLFFVIIFFGIFGSGCNNNSVPRGKQIIGLNQRFEQMNLKNIFKGRGAMECVFEKVFTDLMKIPSSHTACNRF